MKRTFNYIVVEDVDLQRRHLINLLATRLDLRLTAAFENAEDAFEFLTNPEQACPEFIFLDVEMPEANGFDLLDAIRVAQLPARVIMITAFSDYAIKGYDYDISAYLLKPIEPALLYQKIDKAKEEWLKLHGFKGQRQDTTTGSQELSKGHLLIKENKRWVKIDYNEILYCEGANVNVKIVTQVDTYQTRDRVKNLESQLPPDHFLRVHDSFIVNLQHLKSYAGNFSFVEIETGKEGQVRVIKIGPIYREGAKIFIERYLG